MDDLFSIAFLDRLFCDRLWKDATGRLTVRRLLETPRRR